MQSAGVVVLLVVVACACVPSLASSSTQSGAAQPNHPRHTLLALVRAAAALPSPYSHHISQGRQYHHQPFSLARRPSFDFTPARPRDVLFSEFVSKPSEEKRVPGGEERGVWRKRANINDSLVPEDDQGEELFGTLPQVGASLATNFLRHARSSPRPFEVPQIECPPAEDRMERFPCPSPDRMGRYRCIDDHVLCDGFIDCPAGEDEDRQQCMFYKTTKAHLDVLADAIIRFIRGRK